VAAAGGQAARGRAGRVPGEGRHGRGHPARPRGEIEWAKASLVTPAAYAAEAARLRRDTPGPAEQVAAVYAGYEELKNRAELLDFDDILLHTAAALEEHAGVAEEFRDRYRCFVVDEYQDVTALQQRVLDAWLGERDDLTVVGDANQTIYTFAGATPRHLLDFPRRFPEAVVVRLQRDYRSTPQVVACANTLIGGARAGRPARACSWSGSSRPGPEPGFTEHDDEPAEAPPSPAASGGCRRRHPGERDRGAVPHQRQSEVLRAGPHRGGGALPGAGRGAVLRAARGAPRHDRGPHRRGREGGRWSTTCARCSPRRLTAEPPPARPSGRQWESLLALVELAEELLVVEPEAGLPRFAAELQTRADSAHPPAVQGVTLASLHAAKGLEWDVVFLVGLVDGTLPIQHADGDEAAIEEERRLLYVGITRARRRLQLSWSLARQPGSPRRRRRSRFLYGLIPEHHPASRVAAESGRGAPKPRCRVCGSPLVGTGATTLRRCSQCPSDLDVELLDRLRGWRSEQAREQNVPAFVIFTDATLTAIAEQRPSDAGTLVAIPGIGARKLNRYGDAVLALIADG
jgi:DNA helicase-2/ATP-dependent DNA helicase PcrA